jgi:hypothetical protein
MMPRFPNQSNGFTTLATILTFILCHFANAVPDQVLLLRHGEKNTNKTEHYYNLDVKGLQRAINLADMIPRCFWIPSQIHTFQMNFSTSENARSYQTAVPLGISARVNIYQVKVSNSDNSSRLFGEQVLALPQYDRARCVFIWEHDTLPELGAGLGWPYMPPIDEFNYDELYLLSYTAEGGAIPSVLRFNQSILFLSTCG